MILHSEYIAKSLEDFGFIFIQTREVCRHGKSGADPPINDPQRVGNRSSQLHRAARRPGKLIAT